MKRVAARMDGVEIHFSQCPWVNKAYRKDTNILMPKQLVPSVGRALEDQGVCSCGNVQHKEPLKGKRPDGKYVTVTATNWPDGMCKLIGEQMASQRTSIIACAGVIACTQLRSLESLPTLSLIHI